MELISGSLVGERCRGAGRPGGDLAPSKVIETIGRSTMTAVPQGRPPSSPTRRLRRTAEARWPAAETLPEATPGHIAPLHAMHPSLGGGSRGHGRTLSISGPKPSWVASDGRSDRKGTGWDLGTGFEAHLPARSCD